jgi:two-component system sensor histidine kinase AlgZ
VIVAMPRWIAARSAAVMTPRSASIARMREAAGDVGAPQALVERDARRVALHELARRLRKSADQASDFSRIGSRTWLSGIARRRGACASHGLRSIAGVQRPTTGVVGDNPGMCKPRIRAILSRRLVADELDMVAPRPGGTAPALDRFGNDGVRRRRGGAGVRHGPQSAFDVCHVGVVLRALVFVHGVMAIGMVFGATAFAAWLTLTAAGASVALPAVLLWLLVVCALKAQLERAPLARAVATVVHSGAFAAFASSRLIASLLPDAPSRARRAARLPAGARRRGDGGGDLPVAAPDGQATLPAETTARLAELQSRIRRTSCSTRSTPRSRSCASTRPRPRACSKTWPSCFASRSPRAPSRSRSARRSTSRARYLDIEQIRSAAACTSPGSSTRRPRRRACRRSAAAAGRERRAPRRRAVARGGVIRVRTKVKLGRAVLSIANSVPKEPRGPGTAWR